MGGREVEDDEGVVVIGTVDREDIIGDTDGSP
jgi:hypothetical protein